MTVMNVKNSLTKWTLKIYRTTEDNGWKVITKAFWQGKLKVGNMNIHSTTDDRSSLASRALKEVISRCMYARQQMMDAKLWQKLFSLDGLCTYTGKLKSDVWWESFKRRVYGHKQDNKATPNYDKLFCSGNHKGQVYGIINPISALVVIVVCFCLAIGIWILGSYWPV